MTTPEERVVDPDMVLGIDPGTAIMGYGLVRTGSGDHFEMVDYGVITTPAGMPLARRLLSIYAQLNELIDRFHPS